MNDLLVIMSCSTPTGFMEQYKEQLRMEDIDVYVHPLDGSKMTYGGNLGIKCDIYRRVAKQFSNYEKIIISDAFDILFFGSKEEVMAKIPNDKILCAAEKNCYPDPSVAISIPGNTPWRFFNGGIAAGTPSNFLTWIDTIEKHPSYNPNMLDQQFFNIMLANREPFLHIDSTTELFYCLYGGYKELEFEDGLPYNTLCKTNPNFIHANGKWNTMEMFDKLKRSLDNGN